MKKNTLILDESITAFKEDFYQEFVEPNLHPTPLKSIECCREQAHEEINAAFNKYVMDLLHGLELFHELAIPDEQLTLEDLAQKIYNENRDPLSASDSIFTLNNKDVHFLETIAKRALSDNKNAEASKMFQWILSFVPVYSPAWIGAAIAEHQQNNVNAAEDFYLIGLETIPTDSLLRTFAAQFYLTLNDPIKAKGILEQGLQILLQEGKQDSDEFKMISQELSQIK